jgi:hypothetical protein
VELISNFQVLQNHFYFPFLYFSYLLIYWFYEIIYWLSFNSVWYSSVGTTTLSWVSACSTAVEHSQQEGFTEYRCQRHVKPPTWKRTRDLERSNFRHKRPPESEATPANPAAEGGTMGEKWPRNFAESDDLHFTFGFFYMGQTALLPLRRKACWGFFRPKNPTALAAFEPANLSTKGQHATSRPTKPQFSMVYPIIPGRNFQNSRPPFS